MDEDLLRRPYQRTSAGALGKKKGFNQMIDKGIILSIGGEVVNYSLKRRYEFYSKKVNLLSTRRKIKLQFCG